MDLALNYEHVLLIAALSGAFPGAQIAAALYRNSYFEADGALRFRPAIRGLRLRERLRRSRELAPLQCAEAASFLTQLLSIDPASRITAAAALEHPWVKS